MSDPALRHTLTDFRLTVLRQLHTGATRNRDGSLFRLHPTMLAWFVREGYVEESAARPPTDERVRGGKQRTGKLTAKGLEAVGARQEGAAP